MNDEQKNIIENFTGTLLNLDSIKAKVSESGLDWSEGEGEWSIRQIIHHLAEDFTVYGFILERALATPGCKVFLANSREMRPGQTAWDLTGAPSPMPYLSSAPSARTSLS